MNILGIPTVLTDSVAGRPDGGRGDKDQDKAEEYFQI